MGFADYKTTVSSHKQLHDAFVKNNVVRRRFVVTALDGAHLIGVPSASVSENFENADARFWIRTSLSSYKVPYKELAWATPLADEGDLRSSDGQPPVPEPCCGPRRRIKQQKFGILDSAEHLEADISSAKDGCFGLSLIYLDIDKFKELNTRFTETAIDQNFLPEFHRLLASSVVGRGIAYAEGGDEFIILLPNTTERMAIAFALELRMIINKTMFRLNEEDIHTTVSMGLAYMPSKKTFDSLQFLANTNKAAAKEKGRDLIVSELGKFQSFSDFNRTDEK
jgi:diguanylate cyclase (GGDEF)-like protein